MDQIDLPAATGWTSVLGRWRRRPLTTGFAMREYARRNAAFIAQKSAIDYCRVKAGSYTYQLFREAEFSEALTRCRWEGFAAVLADILIVVEAFLRPAAGDRAGTVGDRIAAWYREILAAESRPEHRPGGWDDAVARFEARLAVARAGAPRTPADVATVSARRLFEVLPIHTNHRHLDEEMVVNSVRFRMVALWAEMERRVDREAVCADLAGPAGGDGV